MEFKLIHQIISRIAKENKCFHILRHLYSIDKINLIIRTNIFLQISINLENILGNNKNTKQLTSLDQFLNMNKQYNLILFRLFNAILQHFIKENKLQNLMLKLPLCIEPKDFYPIVILHPFYHMRGTSSQEYKNWTNIYEKYSIYFYNILNGKK